MRKYDVAAYIWPSYTGDELRTRIFWPEGIGEWETVKKTFSKFPGHQWPRKPLWGYVNEADPDVMETQINAAADHGVNVFVYDWYWFDNRPFLENCLNDGYLKAKNNERVKFYLMWANHDVEYTWDLRLSDALKNAYGDGDKQKYLYTGEADRQKFETVCNRLIECYFKHPNYYRIDGKPVFMIFNIAILINGLGGIDKAADAIAWLKQRCVDEGLGGLHLQMNLHWLFETVRDVNGDMVPVGELMKRLSIDSATNYQMIDLVKDADRSYNEVAEEGSRAWERLDAMTPAPYFPHVSVGWDNNPRFKEIQRPLVTDSSPENFKRQLERAKAYLDARPDQVPLVTINSWNEWTEGSYLEPDDLNGFGYLEAVKEVFKGEDNK